MSGRTTAPPPTRRTAQDGTTQVIATLQTRTGGENVGAAQVIASGGNSASVTFTLTAISAAPATLTKVYGDQQTGTVSMQLASLIGVHVEDRYGNPVDASVNFVVTSGGGSIYPVTARSGSAGTTGVQWTLGPTVGTQSVSAQVASITTSFTATANPQPALRWSDTSLTAPGDFHIFEAVSGLSASNVVMAGSDDRVVQLDASTWTELGPVSTANFLAIQGLWMSPAG